MRSTPPSYLRQRGAGVAPSRRPTSEELAVPAAFSYTDDEGETSDCLFYAVADAPVGLVVYLDGDGQFFHSEGNQSRDARYRGGLAGAGGVVEAANARGYDVVTERVWLVGYSGGSEFISQWFFPAYAEHMAGGGFLLVGGGDAPEEKAAFSSGVKGRLSLNWVTGTRDVPGNSLEGFDGIGHARNSLAYYRAASFGHTWSEWPDDDHGSVTEKFGSYVGRVLDAASSGK